MVPIINITSRIMAVESDNQTQRIIKLAYLVLASFSLLLIFLLIPQLFVRYYYQQSQSYLTKNDFYQAEIALEKAREWLGEISFQGDQKRIDIADGNLTLRRAESARTVTEYLQEMERAETLFRAATTRSSFDIEGYTGLAKATTALETVYPFVHGSSYSSNALPIYLHLLQLMPVNIYTHELLIKYYYAREMEDDLQRAVGDLIYLSPPFYFQLKRLPFFTSSLNDIVEKSLVKSVGNGVRVADAYKALSALALQAEDSKTAVDYFVQTRSDFTLRNLSSYYFQLGKLYIYAKHFTEAEYSFIESLKVIDRENRLKEIWSQYARKKYFKEFLLFAQAVTKTKYSSDFLEILQAKCLIAIGRHDSAISHLKSIKSSKYETEILNLQAQIAEYKEDWDTMELRSQRATVLAPNKVENYLILSRALRNQKKWSQAEEVATDAIEISKPQNASLYNNRGWIRWNRKNYDGAEMDWRKAIEISPETASFYYNLSLINERRGDFEKAVFYLKKANNLKPGEQIYLNKLDQLSESE